MEYKEKIKWLRSYLESQKSERALVLELERLRSEAERITPVLSAAPGGGGNQGSIPGVVERIDRVRKQLTDAIETGLDIRKKIAEVVEKVQDVQQQEILRRRYLVGQRWDDIAMEMRLTRRWVMKIHRKAVEKLKIEFEE